MTMWVSDQNTEKTSQAQKIRLHTQNIIYIHVYKLSKKTQQLEIQ